MEGRVRGCGWLSGWNSGWVDVGRREGGWLWVGELAEGRVGRCG